jgi:hypothetical protein
MAITDPEMTGEIARGLDAVEVDVTDLEAEYLLDFEPAVIGGSGVAAPFYLRPERILPADRDVAEANGLFIEHLPNLTHGFTEMRTTANSYRHSSATMLAAFVLLSGERRQGGQVEAFPARLIEVRPVVEKADMPDRKDPAKTRAQLVASYALREADLEDMPAALEPQPFQVVEKKLLQFDAADAARQVLDFTIGQSPTVDGRTWHHLKVAEVAAIYSGKAVNWAELRR